MTRQAIKHSSASLLADHLPNGQGHQNTYSPDVLHQLTLNRAPVRSVFGRRRGWLVQPATVSVQDTISSMPFAEFVGAFRSRER